MSPRSVLYTIIAALVASFAISACGERTDDGAITLETTAEALTFLQTAGEAITGRTARGVMTVDGRSVSVKSSVTDEGREEITETTGIAETFEFESDGTGGIIATKEAAKENDLQHYGVDIPIPLGTQIELRLVDGQGYVGFPSDLISQPDLRAPGDTTWATTSDFPGLCLPLTLIAFRGSEPCHPQAIVHELADLTETTPITVGETSSVNGVEAAHIMIRPGDGISLDMDVWIDGDGLVRRITLDESPLVQELAAAFGGDDPGGVLPELRTTIDFHDFDTDRPAIEAPSSELIVENLP